MRFYFQVLQEWVKEKLAWALAQSLLCESFPASKSEDALFLWNKNLESKKQETQNDFFSEKKSIKDTSQTKSITELETAFQACEVCLSCRSVAKKESADILEIKPETLQIRLQDLKPIASFLSLQSFAKAKIVFIDSAEKT